MAIRVFAMHISLIFLLAIGLCLSGTSYANQPNGSRRVGVLFRGMTSPEFTEQFRRTLGESGWIDGRNIIIEERSGEGRKKQLFELAKELISIKTDVIVVNSAPAAHAVLAFTNTIPIVAIAAIRLLMVWLPIR